MYQSSTDHALALRFWLLVEVNSELFECHDQIRINIPIKWNEETYPKTPCSNKAIHLWVALLAFFSFYCAGWESNYQTAEASVSTNGNEWCIEVQFLTNFFLLNLRILQRKRLVMITFSFSFSLVIKSCKSKYESLHGACSGMVFAVAKNS